MVLDVGLTDLMQSPCSHQRLGVRNLFAASAHLCINFHIGHTGAISHDRGGVTYLFSSFFCKYGLMDLYCA